jgi:hypothetical protein
MHLLIAGSCRRCGHANPRLHSYEHPYLGLRPDAFASAQGPGVSPPLDRGCVHFSVRQVLAHRRGGGVQIGPRLG